MRIQIPITINAGCTISPHFSLSRVRLDHFYSKFYKYNVYKQKLQSDYDLFNYIIQL